MSKIGRNEPCPCGSGKKYKKCHPGEYDSDVLLKKQLSDWPVVTCLVNDDFDLTGLATVIVVRENPENNRLVIASFLCDIFCLGIKNVLFETNTTETRLDYLLDAQPQDFEAIDYTSARDLVLGAYAQNLGFEPHSDYERAKAMIEYDDPFNFRRFEYGRNGRPFYYIGPHDDYATIFEKLDKSCGKGNFDYEIDDRVSYVYDKSS